MICGIHTADRENNGPTLKPHGIPRKSIGIFNKMWLGCVACTFQNLHAIRTDSIQMRTAVIQLGPRPADYPVPLISWQERVWNAMMKHGTRLSEWTMFQASVRVLGPLDVSSLQKSIELVVQRHESLRTRIVTIDGTPRQCIDPACEYRLQTVDLEGSTPDIEMAAKRLILDFADIDRDLSAGPLFEAKLIKLSRHEHLVLVALDHMFSDLLSVGILSRDIWTLYAQTVRRKSPSLPPLPLQFADYAVWQERTYDIWRTSHEAYWRERLSGAPGMGFKSDDGGVRAEGGSKTMMEFSLGTTLSDKLRDVARQEGTLLSLVVLAVYVAAIAGWFMRRDIVLTFLSHGRHCHPELANMIGLLPQQLFFRIELQKEDTFRDLLRRVIRECQGAHQHHDYNRVRDLIAGQPADFFYNWTPSNRLRPTSRQASDDEPLEMQPLQVRRSRVKAGAVDPVDAWNKLACVPREMPNGLVIEVWYREGLFTLKAIENFTRNFRLLAEEFTRGPLTSVSYLSGLPRLSCGDQPNIPKG